ncbi:MAG: family 78 glycoside hydrolase catalytic domain [Limisphaerales bacterium]
MKNWIGGFALWAAGLSVAVNGVCGEVQPAELKCGYAANPLGVDEPHPRLLWRLESRHRGARQAAYQVLVATSREALNRDDGDLWDSGKTASDDTLNIVYAGKPLTSSRQVFWKVRVWDANGKVSAWSKPAAWTMGILQASDWQARWIGAQDTNIPSILLRREFNVKPGLRRAQVNVCGLGQYEMTLNGKRIGDDYLSPGWTKYNKTCLYDTRDITANLRAGKNAAGFELGNGMYNVAVGRYTKFVGSFGPQKFIAQIRLEYADGSVDIVGTDESWRVAAGPITFSSIYGGEDFDARHAQRGWNRINFEDAKWPAARIVGGPGGELRGWSCAAPPLREIETIRPITVKELSNGVEVYDLGQNAPIVPRITVKGPAGSSVRLVPAELLKSDGSVDRVSVGGGQCYWQYTLGGEGNESWFPKFFYHGCRYLQIERAPATPGGDLPVVKDLAGVVVHTASAAVGEFACSNELFNRIHTLIRWAQRANLVSVITDCPHRERLGWLEQYHLNGPSLRYEFDLARLYTKGMNDMADSQLVDGLVPDTAPEYAVHPDGFRDSPEWGSAFVIVPWQQYQFCGDTDLLRRYYEQMKRYVAYLDAKSSADIVAYGLGDWYDRGPGPPGFAQLTPKELTATAFYFYDTWILAQTASLLGQSGEAKELARKADEIRAAFNAKFYNATNLSYSTGSQCANAIPLVMNLCQPENRAAVLDALVKEVQSHGNAIEAGDVGYRYLLRALADGGRSDVIFAMNNQSDKPGYGYQLKQGATSLTEAWDARRDSSQNHFMLGQIMEWFYGDLLGIAPDPDGPGFKRILIRPQPVGDLTWAKGSYDSVRGKIACDWKRKGNELTLKVVIPANVTATVSLPATSEGNVRENDRRASRQAGVRFLRMDDGRAVFEVDAGTYRFTSK